MANLDDIVNVSISLNTASVPGGVFGIQLIAAPLASFTERVRSYSAYDSTNADNLPPEVLAALSDAFAQTPHPAQVKVGRLSMAKAVIAPADAVANAVYSLRVGPTPVSVTAAATPTTSTIATQLATAINAAAAGVTATAVAGTVELVYTAAPVAVNSFSRIQWGATTPSATAGIVASDLAAIKAADNNWYVLNMVERTKQRVLDAAAWTETQEKLFITASAEAAILDPANTTDLGTQLSQYNRTAWLYHSFANTEYADAAWASRRLTDAPGSETWANTKLTSVTPDALNASQVVAIKAKGGNTFERYSTTLTLANPGQVGSGEWIDNIRFRDWLRDFIQTNMVQLMVNRPKVPYTDGGLQMLGANLSRSLREGQRVGGIAPDEVDEDGNSVPGFTITIPRASDVPANVKATRVAYLGFTGRLAGAIHMVNITGSLAYEL